MAQLKAQQNNGREFLKQYDINETKAVYENTRQIYVCYICRIFFVYDEGLFVSNIHNHWTICNIQFNDLKSLIHKCF